MGASKTKLFSERQNRLAALAKALAHPARVAILEHLIQKDSCVCGDIVEELPLSQSTISQHLKAMKDAGIIRGTIDGVCTCYCLDGRHCLELKDAVRKLLDGVGHCC